ncbi:MAG: hypothetical protein JSR58_03545 [Verrucomicrobia bacterium]|nr:hypothetical protein [Verrucomicrobiota bacterium]
MKMYLLILGAVLTAGLQADGCCGKSDATCSASNLSTDEQAFSAKLSERQKKLFCMMSAEQRKAAMKATADPALTADGAVDNVMKDQRVSVQPDEAKTEVR